MTETEPPEQDISIPMIKEETTKDDGRTLIYYSFPEIQTVPDVEEVAHV